VVTPPYFQMLGIFSTLMAVEVNEAIREYINIFSQMYVLACRPVMVEIYT